MPSHRSGGGHRGSFRESIGRPDILSGSLEPVVISTGTHLVYLMMATHTCWRVFSVLNEHVRIRESGGQGLRIDSNQTLTYFVRLKNHTASRSYWLYRLADNFSPARVSMKVDVPCRVTESVEGFRTSCMQTIGSMGGKLSELGPRKGT
jgi:hypothetical protein